MEVASSQTSFGVRDERTPKDVCGEARIVEVWRFCVDRGDSTMYCYLQWIRSDFISFVTSRSAAKEL